MGRTIITMRDVEALRRKLHERKFPEIRFAKLNDVADDVISPATDYAVDTSDSEDEIVSAPAGGLDKRMAQPVSIPEADKYPSRLMKYIPAEVITLYLTLDALIRSSGKIPIFVYWGVFVFGIIATYLYLWRIDKVYKKKQILISVIAYCVWVFALGGPFSHLNWYDPIYGGILLPIFTFSVPLIQPS